MATDLVIVKDQQALRIIQLNRPKALNALSDELFKALKAALEDAFQDKAIKTIWLESSFEKAFCAGGDVKGIVNEVNQHHEVHDKAKMAQHYFELEYGVDLLIEESPKPIVVYSEGITFGGGWGLYAGANLKLASSTARFAMPENQIGLYPDVGSAHYLQQTDWKVGTFLAVTGITISAQEALALDFVDSIVPKDYTDSLKEALAQGLAISELDIQNTMTDIAAVTKHWQAMMDLFPDEATLSDWLSIIDKNADDTVISRAKNNLESASCWSLALTWQHFANQRGSTRAEALNADLSACSKACAHPEFNEGVHAKLIDKNRDPVWLYEQVESVPIDDVNDILLP